MHRFMRSTQKIENLNFYQCQVKFHVILFGSPLDTWFLQMNDDHFFYSMLISNACQYNYLPLSMFSLQFVCVCLFEPTHFSSAPSAHLQIYNIIHRQNRLTQTFLEINSKFRFICMKIVDTFKKKNIFVFIQAVRMEFLYF